MHCLDSLIPSGERGLDGFVCQSWVVTVVRGRDVGWVVGQVGGVVSWMGWLRWGRTGRGWLGLVWIVGFVRIVGFVLRIDGWRTGVGLLGWLGGVLVRRRRPCIEGKLERGGFFFKEAEAGGVAGGDRDQMVVDDVVVVGESGGDPTLGILLSGFAGPDGIIDA